jgi:hypothetical protein
MKYVFFCKCGHELTIHTDMKVKDTYTCKKCKLPMAKYEQVSIN